MKISDINSMSSVAANKIVSDAKSVNKQQDDKEIMEMCKSFETHFINQMFKQMRASIATDGLIPKGKGEEIFSEMLDEQYSKSATEAGGIGLADMMYDQLKTPKGRL